MIKYALIGTALLAVTVIIHAIGTLVLVRLLAPHRSALDSGPRWGQILKILIGTVLLLLFLHLAEILVWAVAFLRMEIGSDLQSFEEAAYFSFVTYTTLGYGDITLSGPWRIMSGIEALNGVLLAGWSTALLFGLVQKILQSIHLQGDRHDQP